MTSNLNPSWLSVAGYTNAGILAAVGTVLAGFARPAMLALPYALTVATAVWRWARGYNANMPRLVLKAGQLYTGAPGGSLDKHCRRQ